jgi:hypothetical protein
MREKRKNPETIFARRSSPSTQMKNGMPGFLYRVPALSWPQNSSDHPFADQVSPSFADGKERPGDEN